MIPLGPRLRMARKKRHMTQTDLARAAGISVSYLNLIEHDKRNAGAALVGRLATALGIKPDSLAAVQDARLVQDLESLAAEPLFRDCSLERSAPGHIVSNYPRWAEGILKLYRNYQASSETLEAMSERLCRDPYMVESSHQIINIITSIRSLAEILEQTPDLPEDVRNSMATGLTSESRKLGTAARALFDFINAPERSLRLSTPAEQVNDFLIDRHNYFEELEKASTDLRSRISKPGHRLNDALFEYMQKAHGITVKFGTPVATSTPGTASQYRHDRKHGRLYLANTLPEASVRFQLVQFLVKLEYGDVIAKIMKKYDLSGEVRSGVRRALANYASSAFLFPYEEFHAACENTRYDIQILRRMFGGSFEQICHRCTTLQRPGSQGVPFAFMRADPAGNISKRFTPPGLQLPRGAGACPLLPIYRSFSTPGRIRTRIGALPEGEKYLYIARTVSKHVGAHGEPDRMYAVMIACELHYMDKIVYADRLSERNSRHIIPLGIHCRTCSRENCQHRAMAFVLQTV